VAGVAVDEALKVAITSDSDWIVRGMAPTVLLAAIVLALVTDGRRRFGLGRNESLQTMVVFLSVVFTTLTVIGVLFRGKSMALTLPWGGGG
jgi:hypothetical protein